jgi:hypothetical protein
MNDYFSKLNISIDIVDNPENFKKDPARSFNNRPTYYNLQNHKSFDYLYDKFSFIKPVQIVYAEFGHGRPHIDADNILCAINHYYDTGGASTIYYEPKPTAVPFCGSEQETVPNFYNLDDVLEQERFSSNNNDVYLLNVNKIHSLSFPTPHIGNRKMVKWQFKVSYEEIYAELANRGYLNV